MRRWRRRSSVKLRDNLVVVCTVLQSQWLEILCHDGVGDH